MESRVQGVAVGVLMVVAGVVLAVAFDDVETPVVGLRQVGVVVAVFGVVELVVSVWRRPGARD